MPDRHVTREDLRAAAHGEVSQEELNRRYRRHLFALCPTCDRERRAVIAELAAYRSRASELEIVQAILEHVGSELARLDAEAAGDLATLEGLSFEHQRRKVERARKRFRNPLVADRLIEASRQAVYSEPDKARHLAELALEVGMRSRLIILDADPSIELMALASAQRANAFRVLGDLPSAEAAMRHALHRLDSFEPQVRAELCSLAASLRRDQRRFEEALAMAERASQLYESQGDLQRAGRNQIIQSHIHNQAGNPQQAITLIRRALDRLDPRQDLRLHLWAQHDLTCYLADAGRHAEARQLLDDNRSLYESYPDEPTLLRRRWVEGKVARGLDEPAEAEAAFLDVRDGFLGRGNGYDAALVSLDLALLYLEQGRTDEVRELAQGMLPIFRAQDIHREALAALVLFVEAASREAVGHGFVKRLADYLQRARKDPSLRFEPSSS